MIVRVRTQLGSWRVRDLQEELPLRDLLLRLQQEHPSAFPSSSASDDALPSGGFSLSPGGPSLPWGATLQEVGLKHGDQLHLRLEEEGLRGAASGRVITKEGNILAKDSSNSIDQKGFRPGKMPLRSMKMQWTLNEFIDLDDQFNYTLKAPDAAMCPKVSLDTASLDNLQQYMWSFNFQKMRIGFLYGHFNEDKSVKVEFIYEPPQTTTDSTFEILEDEEEEERVHKLSELLGVSRVGWLVLHPPREEFFHLTGLEVLTAAELQLEAAEGVNDTSFVTVKMTLDADEKVDVHACQVSKVCMEMVAEGALEVSKHPGNCHVNDTFTVKVELKPTDEVSTNFFMANVPISQHNSTDFVSFFPRPHRLGQPAGSTADLKAQLEKAGKEGWTLLDLLCDFHLLLFLSSSVLDLDQDIPKICISLRDRSVPLDEGYVLLLRSIAGMD